MCAYQTTRLLSQGVMDVSLRVISRNAQLVKLCGTAEAIARYFQLGHHALSFPIVSVQRRREISSYLRAEIIVTVIKFQKLDWKLHRLECQVLSRLDKEKRKSVTPSIRLMLKLYLRRKLQNDNVTNSSACFN